MKRLGVIIFSALMVFASPLAGQTYAPDLQNRSWFDYTFVAGSGVNGSWSYAPEVGPSVGAVGHSVSPTGPLFSLYSVNFGTFMQSGYQATALVSNLGEGNISGTRLSGVSGSTAYGSALDRYKKSAYLASLYFANMGSWSAIQSAIWTIMTPTFAYSSAAYDGTTNWLLEAQNADLSSFDFSSWNVLTPYERNTIPRSRTEMLVQTASQEVVGTREILDLPPTVTPEPETYLLLVSGLIFMVFFGRRRMKEMEYL